MTEIGNRLKEARLEKGLSLEDLQSVTKIQKRYLQGIEEGNYKMMPGPFYVRAFIKQYAEAVELEPEELFEQYKSEIPATFNEDLPEKLSRVQTRKSISGGSSKLFDILPKILVAAFIIGALAAIWYFIPKNSDDDGTKEQVESSNEKTSFEQSEDLTREEVEKEPEKEEAADEEETVTDEPVEEEEPLPTQELTVVETKGKNTVYELKNADKFELKLVSTGETWVNIKNGKGYSFFQGMLVKGSADAESHTEDLTNEVEAVIIIGNALNTEVYINDQKLEYATPPAGQVTQNITIRYIKASQ